MIKKLLLNLFALIILFSNNIVAQAPEGFNYQCVIRDNTGQPIANQAVGVQFNILQGSITGSSVYTESHSTTTNGYGLITLTIGAGTTSDDLSTVDWGSGPYFIHVEADANGGTNYSDVSTTQMMSVPYALYAKYGEDSDADSTNEIQDISLTGTDLSITSGSTLDLSLLQDGTGTDDQDLTGASLTGTTLQIDIENGTSTTVDLAGLQDGVNDADNDPTNEYNTSVVLNGSNLEITDGGGTITTDMSSLTDDGDWTVGSGVVYNTTDNIGIGTTNPTNGSLVVNGTGSNALYVSNLSANRGAYIESLSGTGAEIVSGSGDAVIGTTSSGVAISGNSNTGTAGSFTLSATGTSIISAFDGSAEVFTVDDGGNVGIGITDPVHSLSIRKSNTTTTGDDGTFVDIWNGTSTSGVMSGIRFNNNAVSTSYSSAYKGGIFYKDNGSYGVGDFHFAINNTTSPFANAYDPATIADTRMTIKSTGEVRIQGLAGTGNRMVIADADGDLSTQSLPLGDNLGNHTATQNVILNNNYLSNDGGNEGMKIDDDGNVYHYDNVATPIDGWTYSSNKTVQTITPSDLKQRDESVYLVGWDFSTGTTSGSSYFIYRNDCYVAYPIPYGYTPSRVYFNFAGDGPEHGITVWASPVTANLTAYNLLSTGSNYTGWYNLSFSGSITSPGWYVWIKMDEGGLGDFKFAGGYIEYTRNGW